MSKQEAYNFGLLDNGFKSSLFNDYLYKRNLANLVMCNRIAKKICRKCFRRLPLNSTVCRKCKNPDLRTKKVHNPQILTTFDKDTKKRLFDKRKEY